MMARKKINELEAHEDYVAFLKKRVLSENYKS